MKTLLLLLISLSTSRSFSTVRPLSHFHILPADFVGNKGSSNSEQFRATAFLRSTNTPTTAVEYSVEKKSYRTKMTGLLNNVKTAPFALSIATFLLGLRLGVIKSSTVTQVATVSVRSTARQYPVVATILLLVAGRDTWSLIPNWAKKNIPLIGRRVGVEPETEDPDDLTSFPAISMKLRNLFQRGKEKLSSGQQIEKPGLVFLALIQIMSQVKQQLAFGRDQTYEESGKEIQNPRDVLDGMDEFLDFADWAYGELPEGESLKGNLQAKGYSLLRHEKTAMPGHAAHYVAVSTERREALIGIKGTSGLEDILTDCCGNAVRYNISNAEGDKQEIICHEGVLLSSRRLADDLLTFVESVLLPSGYKITVTGHSLGAGVAVIFSMILRSRIEELRMNDKKLKVLAFASPPILDYESSKKCESFVTTFINNSDIIPRCSLSNLVLLMGFMQKVNQRLDEEGISPKDMKSTAAFAKWLVQGKHGEMLLKGTDIRDNLNRALENVDIDDVDHLYVPGRVVHMFDEWTKEGYGKKNVPTAEKVYVSDGIAKVLRLIEIDDRMMSDHMPPGYRASIRSLLNKADILYPKNVTERGM
mmetsp:Transcript_30084/g.30447  ORF Transcript_30084/g.30447 Transcript_30084/m.30447 type:complete len:589 (-) Transcript_30084:352-2118(-)